MGIKICKEKFENNCDVIGSKLYTGGQFFFENVLPFLAIGTLCYALIFPNTYEVFGNVYWNVDTIMLVFASVLTLMVYHMILLFAIENMIWYKINKKLKLFEWNEDC